MKANESKSESLLILHGMFSHAGNMSRLKRAIESRSTYKHIGMLNLDWNHKLIPQLGAANRALELKEGKLKSWLIRNGITGNFDVCGHSNGGYVAMSLGELLPMKINKVFTIGTPRGLQGEYVINKCNVFHFWGGMDAIPKIIRGQCNHGNGRWSIEFPDEGHSSIHSDADSNGLADIISFINGGDLPFFYDNKSVLHIWPWCQDDIPLSRRSDRALSLGIRVCNGIHDNEIDNHKYGARGAFLGPIQKISFYLNLHQAMKRKQNILRQEISFLRLHNTKCAEQIKEIERENKVIDKKILEFEKKVSEEIKSLSVFGGRKLRSIRDPLKKATTLSKMDNFSDNELAVVTELIKAGLQEHTSLWNEFRGKSLYLGGGK